MTQVEGGLGNTSPFTEEEATSEQPPSAGSREDHSGCRDGPAAASLTLLGLCSHLPPPKGGASASSSGPSPVFLYNSYIKK